MVLSDAEVQLIESMGLFFERLGNPRIGGRMAGLMLLASEPLALEEIANLLKVSKASVSTNSRQFLAIGVIEEVSFPGDRRTYYRFNPRAWEDRLVIAQQLGATIEALALQGLGAIASDNEAARQRLDYTREFGAFLQEGVRRLQEEWRTRRSS